ncbi:hypothetical protein N0V93_002981 [Gnomoniopsis smithogilvyi]|uniref:Uncharacterized protein n=1 Tax=Gnomoniopsis smithogilvyi TaxID=1191159 RepID=A0A9W8YXS0_9PEZI|nr:hypothetical protein N0V93_002981 [Gnomoniopsis smithogilvyi]
MQGLRLRSKPWVKVRDGRNGQGGRGSNGGHGGGSGNVHHEGGGGGGGGGGNANGGGDDTTSTAVTSTQEETTTAAVAATTAQSVSAVETSTQATSTETTSTTKAQSTDSTAVSTVASATETAQTTSTAPASSETSSTESSIAESGTASSQAAPVGLVSTTATKGASETSTGAISVLSATSSASPTSSSSSGSSSKSDSSSHAGVIAGVIVVLFALLAIGFILYRLRRTGPMQRVLAPFHKEMDSQTRPYQNMEESGVGMAPNVTNETLVGINTMRDTGTASSPPKSGIRAEGKPSGNHLTLDTEYLGPATARSVSPVSPVSDLAPEVSPISPASTNFNNLPLQRPLISSNAPEPHRAVSMAASEARITLSSIDGQSAAKGQPGKYTATTDGYQPGFHIKQTASHGDVKIFIARSEAQFLFDFLPSPTAMLFLMLFCVALRELLWVS